MTIRWQNTITMTFVPGFSLNVVLFDDPAVRLQLLPFTYTRPVAGIRCGVSTITEKWNAVLDTQASFLTEDYLSEKFPLRLTQDNLYINGAVCPDDNLVRALRQLETESVLLNSTEEVIALRTGARWSPGTPVGQLKPVAWTDDLTIIRHIWQIPLENGTQIRKDVERITAGRSSAALDDPFTSCYGKAAIFIEEGASVRAAVLNAEDGPIYIGKNAVVGEGSTIQGPFAIGEGGVLAQVTRIRPNTTIGPWCKVGGEINNAVMFAHSNKAHDGYLGNSVIGEWCNLGANTNNSNLKNDYTPVRLFSYASNQLENTGLLFCGVFIGDYTKAGISTMFNTGTVVGVNVNVFGADFQPKHIPSFSWGGQLAGFSVYRYDKALAVIRETRRQKGWPFEEQDESILWEVYERTMLHRSQNDIHSFRNES